MQENKYKKVPNLPVELFRGWLENLGADINEEAMARNPYIALRFILDGELCFVYKTAVGVYKLDPNAYKYYRLFSDKSLPRISANKRLRNRREDQHHPHSKGTQQGAYTMKTTAEMLLELAQSTDLEIHIGVFMKCIEISMVTPDETYAYRNDFTDGDFASAVEECYNRYRRVLSTMPEFQSAISHLDTPRGETEDGVPF